MDFLAFSGAVLKTWRQRRNPRLKPPAVKFCENGGKCDFRTGSGLALKGRKLTGFGTGMSLLVLLLLII